MNETEPRILRNPNAPIKHGTRTMSQPQVVPQRQRTVVTKTRAEQQLDSDDPLPIDTSNREWARIITDARTARNMKRKQLAAACMVKEADITGLETNTLKNPPQQLILRLQKVLGVKLYGLKR